jgi:stage II sporulation protein D
MRKWILIGCVVLAQLVGHAQNTVRVGLFVEKTLSHLTMACTHSWTIVCDSLSYEIPAKQHVHFSFNDSSLSIEGATHKIIPCKHVAISSSSNALFAVSPSNSKSTSYKYVGSFELKRLATGFGLINILPIETYVGGVVEAEGGANKPLEYYKVQAMISRTYALRDLNRHVDFDVCDGTHCQVFHGMSTKDPNITLAVEQTKKLIIVDENAQAITAVFHSNCGGHTLNAEQVWKNPLPYCIGKEDPYCMGMPHSNWEKRIPIEEWTNYLESKKITPEDTLAVTSFFPDQKVMYYQYKNVKIRTTVIRSDMKLRSAFFIVHMQDDEAVFIGQGFGHGVGLCQEGAMNMASKGKKAEEIINFYYTGVHIVPYDMLWFFSDNN